MSTAFLCVQFRNLLPSEQLLLFARALWSDLQQRGLVHGAGDATLTITQIASEITRFEAELRLANLPDRCRARDTDALATIERVFAEWSVRQRRTPQAEDTTLLGESDALGGAEWQSDTALR
jgi:hypothetical protein